MTSPPPKAYPNEISRANRWLALILIGFVSCSLLLLTLFILRGDSPGKAWSRSSWTVVPTLVASQYSEDSWGPMGRAFLRSQTREDGDIYGIFFDEHKKFQYPPTSLLVFFVIPDSWMSAESFIISENHTTLTGPMLTTLRTASQMAVLITIAASIAILELGLSRLTKTRETNWHWRAARIAIMSFLGLTFYPLVWGHTLGQIQVMLNALTALGILAHMLGWQARSGWCLGLCCLLKPQYGIVLIWALFRRNWRVMNGFLLAVVPMGLISLYMFGWTNHMRYIEVIREIARLGESFWANQCMNGFLNRLLGNGDPLVFSPVEFAPYHPLVHAVTVGTSLIILGLALVARRASVSKRGTLDLAVVVAAATMASPVAWEHHYGAFLPLFALALPACLNLASPSRLPALVLAAAYLAMSVGVLTPDVFFAPVSRGWTASHLFFGAVLFFGLLLHVRQASWKGEAVTAASPRQHPANQEDPIIQAASS